MPAPNIKQRRERLQQVLKRAQCSRRFTPQEIVEACEETTSRFVNQVLKQLASEGLLQEANEGRDRFYIWQTDPQTFSPHSWIDRQVAGKQITSSPQEDRPRERLMRLGPKELRTAELLAILIRVGRQGESALDAGEKISNQFAENFADLRCRSHEELREVSRVISSAAYCQIMAGIELGRRVVESMHAFEDVPEKIDSTAKAMAYCRKKFARLALDRRQEEFHVVTLDTKLFPIAHHQITVGTLDASLVHPREVFRAAIRDAASAIILLHNHPSGDPTPSREDHQVTDRLKKTGEIVGIRVLDHIVVAANGCASIAESEK
ncbi:MAG: DNA repair protein RadC [Pirellulaceae bacterium]